MTRRKCSFVSLIASPVLSLLALHLGCGGASSGGGGGPQLPTITSVTVTCSPSQVLADQTSQCTSNVQGTGNLNPAVTWSVQGGSANGTINQNGLYTAPDPLPNPATVTIIATSQLDSTKSGSASVSLSHPVPTLTGISPNTVPAGSGDTSVMLSGSGFTKASVATLSGAPLKATFSSPQQLSVVVPASNEAAPVTLMVAVSNPPPGGGTSASTSFQVVGESLTVAITGLPNGTDANVSVTGPAGFNAALTSSQTLTVTPGTYTIIAAGVGVGNSTYFAAVLNQMANIAVGGTASVSVDYSEIIPNATKVLDAAGIQGLSIAPDGATLTLPATSAVAQSLTAGDVLVSGPAPAAPQGLLRKVLSVNSNGAQIIVVTASATLVDAIQQGSFHLQSALGPQVMTVFKAKLKGVRLLPALSRPKKSPHSTTGPVQDSCAGNQNTFVLQIPDEDLGNFGIVTANGDLEFCPELAFDWSIGLGGPLGLTPTLKSFDAAATLGEHSHLNLMVNSSQGFDTGDVELGTLTTAQPLIVTVGPIPVVVQPSITFFAGANGNITGQASTGVTQDFSAMGDLTYSGGQLTARFSQTHSLANDPVGVDVTGSVKGYAGADLKLLLYGVVAPYFKPDLYLQLSADVQGDPWWTLAGGLEGSAGLDIEVFDDTLASFGPVQLFDFPVQIADAGGPFAPAPTVLSVSPNAALQGGGSQTIAVTGSNFVPNASVYFSGSPISTAFEDPADLMAVIPAAALAFTGNFAITVINPDTGTPSNPATFTVAGVAGNPNPLPVLSSLSPASEPQGAGPVTLTLSGSGFIPASVADVDGVPGNTSFVSSSQLTLPLTVSDLSASGLLTVTVTNPAPGGGTSNALQFLVGVGVSVSPSSASLPVGGTQTFQATVVGSNNSAVSWSLQEGAVGGTVTQGGVYTAPAQPGLYHAIATSLADPSRQGSAAITVVPSSASGVFLPTGNLTTPREFFTATLLPNDQVLVAGGIDALSNVLNTGEIYDLRADTFQPVSSAMSSARYTANAVLLPDGKALVLGGVTDLAGDATATADFYDPIARTFSSAGIMTTPRAQSTATVLPNGKVLIAGGVDSFGFSGSALNSAELYDPVSSTFAATGSMTTPRVDATAVLLPDGEVMICGGYDASNQAQSSAELYNPSTGTFSPTGSMSVAREDHTATLLPSGGVLVAGGHAGFFDAIIPLSSAELYDPQLGSFSLVGSMSTARLGAVATLLGDGHVLVAGGADASTNTLASAELFDPASNSFSPTGSMAIPRVYTAATLLPTLEVLVPGGQSANETSFAGASATADLYEPPSSSTPATPQITALSALRLNRAELPKMVVIQGRNFLPGSSMILQSPNLTLTIKASFTSSTLLGITIPRGAGPGEYSLTVSYPSRSAVQQVSETRAILKIE